MLFHLGVYGRRRCYTSNLDPNNIPIAAWTPWYFSKIMWSFSRFSGPCKRLNVWKAKSVKDFMNSIHEIDVQNSVKPFKLKNKPNRCLSTNWNLPNVTIHWCWCGYFWNSWKHLRSSKMTSTMPSFFRRLRNCIPILLRLTVNFQSIGYISKWNCYSDIAYGVQ